MIVQKSIEEHIQTARRLQEKAGMLEKIESIVQKIVECYRADGKVLFCGNGGSAADSLHLASELSGRFYKERSALFAEALSANDVFLTAVGNDYGFDQIFARAVEAKGKKGDILMAFTTSGDSKNIINALQKARELGLVCIVFTGNKQGKAINHGELVVEIPSGNTPRIQEMHILLGHIICQEVEDRLFPDI